MMAQLDDNIIYSMLFHFISFTHILTILSKQSSSWSFLIAWKWGKKEISSMSSHSPESSVESTLVFLEILFFLVALDLVLLEFSRCLSELIHSLSVIVLSGWRDMLFLKRSLSSEYFLQACSWWPLVLSVVLSASRFSPWLESSPVLFEMNTWPELLPLEYAAPI